MGDLAGASTRDFSGGGAAAGIAATFNAPLGGIVFAVELLLVSISATTLLPVALAVVVATHTGRFLLGMTPAFDIPALQMPTFEQVPFGELMISFRSVC